MCPSVFRQASPSLPPWSTPSYCGSYLTPLLPPHIPSAISPLSTVIAGQDCVRSWWLKNRTAEQWRRLTVPSLCCVWMIMNQRLHLTCHTRFCTTMELTGGTLECALAFTDLEHPLSSLLPLSLPSFPPSFLPLSLSSLLPLLPPFLPSFLSLSLSSLLPLSLPPSLLPPIAGGLTSPSL